MLRKSSPQFSRKLNDMKSSYETPEMNIIELEDRDVIVASGGFIDGPGDSGTSNY